MNKLTITKSMSMDERNTRNVINGAIDHMNDANQLKNWLLDQVTGVTIDGVVYTYPWLTYEQALSYFNEVNK